MTEIRTDRVRCRCFAAVITAVLLVLASAAMSFAGVVVAETSTARGPNGETFSEAKTIYVQGNKQKVDRVSVSEVADLDKSVIYIIDKNRREYTEMPLQAFTPAPPGDVPRETIQLDKTGKTRVIADQPCDEYRRVEASKLERVAVSACVSTGAPGAKDISEFERKMVTRLGGGSFERPADHQPATLMLEKQSVLSFRVPDPSGGQAYRVASLLAETRVNKIQLKPLAPETFNPPKGYTKLPNRPRSTAPPDASPAPGQTVDAVVEHWPADS
jgi:hypothetical protein